MDKNSFRNQCKKKVDSLTKIKRFINDKHCINNLHCLLKKQKAKNIMSFMPMLNEPNVDRYFNKQRRKYNIYVPFMVGVSFKLVKYRLPLRKGRFGIKEPGNSLFKLIRIDLAIVPVLGVDGNMQRVGFGKGMYDRFFGAIKKKPLIIFTQLEECLTKKKICEEHDIQANIYVTSKKIYKQKRANAHDNRAKFSSSRCACRR